MSHDDPHPGGSSTPPDVVQDPAESDEARRRSRTALVAALAVVLVALGVGVWFVAADDGDGSGTGQADGGGSGPSPWGTRWEVVAVTEGGKARPVLAGQAEALVVELGTEGRISFNGCNGGSGAGRLEDGRLVIEDGFSATEMACTGPDGEALMDQDAWLAEFFSAGPTVTIDGGRDGEGDTLQLRTDEATMDLVSAGPIAEPPAEPGDPEEPVSNDPDAPSLPDPGQGSSVPTTSIAGGSVPGGGSVGAGAAGSPGAAEVWGERWTITVLSSTSGSVGSARSARPDRDGSAPVLDLTTDGRVAFTGCNGGTSSARLDGDRLLVDAMVSTRMACGGPDGEALMAQDATITEILEAGPTVTVDGDSLLLSSDVGTIEATRQG